MSKKICVFSGKIIKMLRKCYKILIISKTPFCHPNFLPIFRFLWYNKTDVEKGGILEEFFMIFDTHAHYDDDDYSKDREALLAKYASLDKYRIVNVGASMEGSLASIDLAERYPFIFASVGLHPDYALNWSEGAEAQLRRLSKHPKCVAIGEIGLDYYYEEPEREAQKVAFEGQLRLARSLNKPVIIHSRDAAGDTMDLLKESKIEECGGIMHCFSYPPEVAKQALSLGFYIGIGGALTFKNARKLPDVVAMCPMDRIVLETDCPYMAPVPYRGQRNESTYLNYVCSRIAEIKKISAEEVERITYENALRVYRLVEVWN